MFSPCHFKVDVKVEKEKEVVVEVSAIELKNKMQLK
jgi:hypothetical protein